VSRTKPIFSFHYRKHAPGSFKETYHAHHEMEFVYVHQGTGTLIINQQTYDISSDTLLMFQPFQLHRVSMLDTDASPFIRTLITFDAAAVEAYLKPHPILLAYFKHLYQDQQALPLLKELPALNPLTSLMEMHHSLLAQSDSTEKLEAGMHFLSFFIRNLKPLWQQREQQPIPQPARSLHRAELIMDWIERHFREPFELDRLAGELYLSPHRVSHLFKEATGTSISEYLTSRRIREASLLLTSSDSAVKDIAEAVGYGNCSHFCHVFKRSTGLSPYQFRLVNRRNRTAT
jgi:AraC family transcriptional regulator of arabinose operon